MKWNSFLIQINKNLSWLLWAFKDKISRLKKVCIIKSDFFTNDNPADIKYPIIELEDRTDNFNYASHFKS